MKVIEDIEKNSKEFFKYAKRYHRDMIGIGELKDGGKLISDDKQKANILQSQ